MNALFMKSGRVAMHFQSETNECGIACLAMISSYFGNALSLNDIRERYRIHGLGASVKDLIQAANKLKLSCRPLKLELNDIDKLKLPVILHWDLDHFVVLTKVSRGSFTIHDPAVGVRQYSLSELNFHFTGIALELSPRQDFVTEAPGPRLTLGQLFKPSRDFFTIAIQVFFLSVAIQLLGIASPVYLQLVIDQGISLQDHEFIILLAMLFLIITLAKSAVSYFRGIVLLQFSSQTGFQLARDTFSHLIRLPINFFEHREIGDIVSRFGSLETIKQMVTQEMITVVVDGLFSFVTLALLFIYSPLLAGIALIAISLFSLIRVLALKREKALRQEVLVAGASQQTSFIENVRTIATTKLYALETQRANDWLGDYTKLINSGYFLGKFQLSVGTVQSLLFGVDHIITILLGTGLVLNQTLTIGQLMSFIFLKQHFVSSVSAMVPKLAEIQLMRLELERLSDIALHKTDVVEIQPALVEPAVRGGIKFDKLGFRYGENSPWIIYDISVDLTPGQSLGIWGHSGCGKSTLLKLLLGLQSPTLGEVSIDGIVLTQETWPSVRSKVAAVTHGETALTGSIAFNIHLGLDDFNEAKLRRACQLTGFESIVDSLPMGFSTPLTEAGALLSAGQLQRLLLTRALYHQPRILVLDEALSHLGDAAALEIIARIKSLNLTLVLVTHNPVLIERTDQQLLLGRETGANSTFN